VWVHITLLLRADSGCSFPLDILPAANNDGDMQKIKVGQFRRNNPPVRLPLMQKIRQLVHQSVQELTQVSQIQAVAHFSDLLYRMCHGLFVETGELGDQWA
jgi:hypothetical protein